MTWYTLFRIWWELFNTGTRAARLVTTTEPLSCSLEKLTHQLAEQGLLVGRHRHRLKDARIVATELQHRQLVQGERDTGNRHIGQGLCVRDYFQDGTGGNRHIIIRPGRRQIDDQPDDLPAGTLADEAQEVAVWALDLDRELSSMIE